MVIVLQDFFRNL